MVNKPKISIVISVYNGEGFLKKALRSIQNQNFNHIEIIIVDDFSKDNSLNLIKELMKEDPRIKLLVNKENKGALYTKTKGILNAKGKYVMTLDVDDLYISKYAFSTLYKEAEKYNLDILGFSSISHNNNILNQNIKFLFNYESPIIFKPNITQKMYYRNANNTIERKRAVIWCFFIKTLLFIESIKEIDKKYLNRIMNVHDDMLLLFVLFKNAKSFKNINQIFHIYFRRVISKNPLIIFHNKLKEKNRAKNNCLAYLSYIEFLLYKTNDTIYDKQIASFELKKSFLNTYCRNLKLIKQESINIFKMYLKNKYILNDVKKDILSYIKTIS